ncbi:nucleotide exchange factor GrpE [Haloimpatiens sp. FM7330]|uniref:nucleotide exchange factor GrpE n=1 Tax=Haloimpatiens sp. FM7330 TaxID=3298610 RepID=UPI003633AED7
MDNEENKNLENDTEFSGEKVDDVEEVLHSNEEEEEEEQETEQSLIEKLKDENNKTKDENDKLSNQLDSLKDRLERTTAEYDNYRKRTSKEKERIYTDACEDILKTVLPVMDNLERAVDVDGNVEDLKKGIEITVKQLQESFDKLGVEEISTDNGFDPNLHNAVMHVEDDKYKENEIVEVFQKGYQKGEKVIRYSMVKVAN